MRYSEMTGSLFRYYHREVLKTISREEKEDDHEEVTTKDIISVYVDTIVSIVTNFPEDEMSSSKRNQEYFKYLSQLIASAGS